MGMGMVGMIRGTAAVIAIASSVAFGGIADAQQDADGDGLYEICVWTWSHDGSENMAPGEVTPERLEELAAEIFHAEALAPNADGTCPASRSEATSLEITYCVWDMYEVWDTGGIRLEYGWRPQRHSLPYYEQHLATDGANIAPYGAYPGCPVDPPAGFV